MRRSVPVIIEEGDEPAHWAVRIGGRRFDVEVLDERARAIREMTGSSRAAQGPRPVRAPMPGLVVRLEVEVGESVAAGQGIVIVEAMKMMNPVEADCAGTVIEILPDDAAAVEAGTALFRIRKAVS